MNPLIQALENDWLAIKAWAARLETEFITIWTAAFPAAGGAWHHFASIAPCSTVIGPLVGKQSRNAG